MLRLFSLSVVLKLAFLLGDGNFDMRGWFLCLWDQLPIKTLNFEYLGKNAAHMLHSAATERSQFQVTSAGVDLIFENQYNSLYH